MATCLIGLGSNLGDRAGNLRTALQQLAEQAAITSVEVSSFHATRPVGGPAGQGEFLNAAARFETALAPQTLLDLLQSMEQNLGRQRGERWGPRVVDLDLLLYDREVLGTPALQLPHPRMSFRRFVLAPAVEIAAEMIHPTTKWSVRKLLEHLDTAIDYVAVTGVPDAGKSRVVMEACESLNAAGIIDTADASTLRSYLRGEYDDAVEIELRLAEQRSARLLQHVQRSGPVVSDFWFDQSLAVARIFLSSSTLAPFESRWSDLRSKVAAPKLLVFLDVARDTSLNRHSELTLAQFQQLDANLRNVIAESHQGPVLILRDSETAVAEICAAIQAM